MTVKAPATVWLSLETTSNSHAVTLHASEDDAWSHVRADSDDECDDAAYVEKRRDEDVYIDVVPITVGETVTV